MTSEPVITADQEDLLISFVEAARSVDRGDRRPFYGSTRIDSPLMTINHPGLGHEFNTYPGDIDELGRQGLLNVQRHRHAVQFDISPRGFLHYEELVLRSGEAPQRIVAEMRHHIDADAFRTRCQAAYENWTIAESLLWQADSPQQLTAIGHHCREALQECMHALTLERDRHASSSDKAKTIARAKALIDAQKAVVGESVSAYLEALLAYWGTLSDLVQRQEHGAAREMTQLTWQDARRVVVGTLLVMTEFALAMNYSKSTSAT